VHLRDIGAHQLDLTFPFFPSFFSRQILELYHAFNPVKIAYQINEVLRSFIHQAVSTYFLFSHNNHKR